jgi:hypothetical protein
MDGDLAFRLAELRGQISDLGGAIRQLQRAGLDNASAQLLITRKRSELECLMNLGSRAVIMPATHSTSDVSGQSRSAAPAPISPIAAAVSPRFCNES